jgi:phosphatidylglycerophosphate synthase
MLGVVLALPDLALTDAAASEGRASAPRPDERLAGLSLALRTALTLQKEGAKRLLLVIRSGDEGLLATLRADRRLRVPTEALVVGEAPAAGSSEGSPSAAVPPSGGEATAMSRAVVAAMRAVVTEPFLLGRYDVVVDPAIYRRLREAPPVGALGSLAARGGTLVGPLRAAPALLAELTSLDARSLRKLAAQGALVLQDVGTAWSVALATPEDRRRATFQLFEACRKSVDGFVARHLNRHVSLWISKRIVDTPISPNAMTIMTFVIGLVGAAIALQGGYLPFLVGAALMQVNSILDGVDGELARVRFQHSQLGQWLDTVGDDASNFFFFAALAWGVRSQPAGAWLSLAGWIVTATTVLTAALYYSELVGSGSGDLYALEWEFDKKPPAGLKGKLVLVGRTVLKQDFFVFTWFCLALFGALGYALPMFALGGVVTVIAATGRRISHLRAKGRAGAGAGAGAVAGAVAVAVNDAQRIKK